MKKLKRHHETQNDDGTTDNPFEALTEELLFAILDFLDVEPSAKKSFSLVSKWFYTVEARHRRVLRLLRAEHLPALAARYRSMSEVDLSLCPRVGDGALEVVAGAYAGAYAVTLRRLNLSLSWRFTGSGLLSVGAGCGGLGELDLSNATELRDGGAAAVAQAGNLRKLWLARCRLVTDMGIGCIAVGCRKTNLCMHAEETERKCYTSWRGALSERQRCLSVVVNLTFSSFLYE